MAAAPLLQAEIDIDAPVSTVWGLISDLSRMPEWSPQCTKMNLKGPLQPGTRTTNWNKRGFLVWPTRCTITEVIPQEKLAFRVDDNRTVWSYELQPTDSGTRVIESRHAENGTSAISSFLVRTVMGGVPNFENELVDGMKVSLGRIKAAAERG